MINIEQEKYKICLYDDDDLVCMMMKHQGDLWHFIMKWIHLNLVQSIF